jgi:hypothetical protein
MRGEDERSGALFSYVDLEAWSCAGSSGADDPHDRERRSGCARRRFFGVVLADGPAVDPTEKLLRAMLLQAFYSIRSEPWDSGTKRNVVKRSEFERPFQVRQSRLEGRLEPEAFTWGEVGCEDDLLDVLVGCPVDIQWRGSHRRKRPLAFSMPPFCYEA